MLFDYGYVSTIEPFQRLVNQGLILGEMQYTAFRRESGEYVSVKDVVDLDEEATDSGRRIVGYTKGMAGQPAEKVVGESVSEDAVNKAPGGFQLTEQPGVYVDARSFKMSKSRGNVINPDAVVAEYGADALRPVRDVHGAAGTNQALEHGGRTWAWRASSRGCGGW